MKPKLALGALVSIGLMGVAWRSYALSRRARTTVSTGLVAPRVMARATVVSAQGLVDVRAQVQGLVRKVLVEEGARVVQGQVLAELDDALWTAELQRREAERDALVAAKPKNGSTAVKDAAAARLRAAEQWVHAAELERAQTRIVAPIGGLVLRSTLRVGQSVGPGFVGEALVQLRPDGDEELLLELEEEHAGCCAVGALAVLYKPGERTVWAQARVYRVGAELALRSLGRSDPRARASALVQSLWARFEGTAPTALLGTRLEAELRLPDGPADALRLPREALIVRDGRVVVERPGSLGTEFVPVRVLAADARFVRIEGLSLGTEVLLQD